jgi:hypothetical protein
MRAMIFAGLLLGASTAQVFAGDVMASRYGNTTIATDAAGIQTKIYYKADGTFSGKQVDLRFNGTWKVYASKLCLTFTDQVPNGMTNPFCVPVASHKIGDTWKARDFDVSLIKGVR